jgi:formylglycine-generating enzyme required for sulfatase activity
MRLTHRAYESFGGVRGAIVTRAEKLSAEIGEPITRYLPDLFHELVEVDEQGNAMRKRANIILFQNNPAILQLIEVFTQARLFTQGSAKDTLATIEIAHEALLHNWPRLADWLEKSREDLRLLRQVRLAAAEWERSQRNPDFLWRGERSKTLQIMLDRLHPHLNSSERLFAVPETHWLLEEIKSQSPTHYRRASIGDRLAEISDVRPGVGVDQNGRPDIVWCSVQGGEVTLVDIRRGRVEHTLGTFPVAPFCIAKFPLTWVQYRAFLEDPNGYANPKWWNGLAIRQNKPGQQARPVANHPAENVSWYDAIAYCRWLSAQLGYEVRLPTEWEWQQSATGGNPDCLYPWGNHFNSIYANTYESGLGRSTAVGMYPHGASPVGALDMSGNIREWCLNGYETPEYTEVFAEDELAGQKTRALRGGSWRYDQVVALTSYRYGRYTPDTRNDNLGMRLATQALPIPEHGAK